MIKIRINLVITAVWIAMLALLLIQVYQTIQLYDRKSDDFKSKVNTAIERISLRHEKTEDLRRYMALMNKDFTGQYQDVLREEFQNLFEVKESISIRDTVLLINGELQNYLVVVGTTHDSITGLTARQEVLARDVRQVRQLFDHDSKSLFDQDSIKAAYHLDQRVMHKIVKKAKYINELMVETFRDNVYMEPSKRINPVFLDSIIRNELKKDKLATDYEFVITEENNNPVTFVQKVARYNTELDTNKAFGVTLFPNSILEDKLVLHVSFPNTRSFVLKAMGSPLIISLALVVLIIVTITYMFRTILTQKKLGEIKNDFISNMTHEFKTPISTISLACEAMSDPGMMGGNVQHSAPFVKMISEENKRLENLVEAILQSAVIDRGELRIRNEEVPLVEVIREVAKAASFRIAGNDGELVLDVPKEEVFVVADRMHVTNMISNLIDNAIKYSPNKIHVTVKLEVKADKIVFSVSDKGIGIKREHIQKIFDKLYRVPTGNVHNVKGFGLGLSYVSALVTLFGWNIQVSSQYGEGSVFTVNIKK
ncbi:MAG: HAMP domain-containing sensor histidine kinase [Fluviicola sp.]|nr:HAMP domain-containing sensor histidine kinase [Fluviicola sp.]